MFEFCFGWFIGVLGLIEFGVGLDVLGLMWMIVCCDGDFYVLNGGKIYIINGFVVDFVFVYVKIDRDKGVYGIFVFIVEKFFLGYKVV